MPLLTVGLMCGAFFISGLLIGSDWGLKKAKAILVDWQESDANWQELSISLVDEIHRLEGK